MKVLSSITSDTVLAPFKFDLAIPPTAEASAIVNASLADNPWLRRVTLTVPTPSLVLNESTFNLLLRLPNIVPVAWVADCTEVIWNSASLYLKFIPICFELG